jgi:enediyne biosynthesis protein E4
VRNNLHLSRVALICVLLFFSCGKKTETQSSPKLFALVDPDHSGIQFVNTLVQSDEFNIIEYLYFYNGAGVAAGDINNDGLTDLYFGSNQGSNKLYLNKGDFRFEDITISSGTSGLGNWKTGVSMADVNGDGNLDIFICGVGRYKKFNGFNQLLINNGNLTFTDRTREAGLSFQGFSSQANFFDYDNDGDLDFFLVNHSVHTSRSYGDVTLRDQSDALAGDKLYRNDLIPVGTLRFTEVTSAAGIHSSQVGYGLSAAISDLNNDGYSDIYVCNDFHENDYLYLNKGDGTFRQVLEQAFGHTTRFSMGSDIGDINNDGWSDIVTLDMQPNKEDIIKTTAGEDPFDIFQYKLRFGYHYQFTRNALQLNHGAGQDGLLRFSDIASLSGLEATDWSWSSLLADFDNDGLKDLFVTNGIVGRPNDLDYINYISGDSAQRFLSDDQFIEKMPSGKTTDYFFRNEGNLKFSKSNDIWYQFGEDLSNGAAYSDLDNDGDLDLVINHVNSTASVLRNNQSSDTNFLKVRLKGEKNNVHGIGGKVIVHAGGRKVFHEQFLSRGWMSSVDPLIHIGLGKSSKVDSVEVMWPGGKKSVVRNIASGETLIVDQSQSSSNQVITLESIPLFTETTTLPPHVENEFVPFNVERLIPHSVSAIGPMMSMSDVNGDGKTDLFVGGAAGQAGSLYLRNGNGQLAKSPNEPFAVDAAAEDVGSCFFDADLDGDRDLLVAGGGGQFTGNDPRLNPRLYTNDGRGHFTRSLSHFKDIFVDASVVRAADIDNDKDIDVFIGGRVIAGQYGISPKSYVLVNDGSGDFYDATETVLPNNSPGMITDALWLDVNKDELLDLVLAGEWMPITILVQERSGKFRDQTTAYGLSNTSGLWNSLFADDFDNDGDADIIAGNLGLNSRLKADSLRPIELFVGDIDLNGGTEQILTYYNGDERYPFLSRDQLIKQVPSLKRKFLRYQDYGNVKIEDIVGGDVLKGMKHLRAEMLESTIFRNDGQKFFIQPLPVEAQFSPVYSICGTDVNDDGFKDLLVGGNLFDVQPEFGRYDASYGALFYGNAKGTFTYVPASESGFVAKGQIRDIKTSVNSQGVLEVLVARNNDSILVFKHK